MQLKNGTSLLVVDLKKGAAIEKLSLCNEPILRSEDGGYYQAALLFPFPNRLKYGQYSFEGKNYAFPHNDIELPNALHGMVHDREFTIDTQGENHARLKLSYGGEEERYPFPFDLFITYQLKETGLETELEVVNTGSGNMPCGFGWHPYFYTEEYEKAELKLPTLKQVEIDDLMIPTGRKGPFNTFDAFEKVSKQVLDTCFKLNPTKNKFVSLLKLSNGNIVEVWQDSNFEYLQVFTPKEKTSVAIEPMTCNIDALNNGEGLRILAPQEHWKVSFGIKLKK